MIKVSGRAILKVHYTVNLPITEEAYEALSEREAQALLDEHINWQQILDSAEADEIEVWDYEETRGDDSGGQNEQ